MLIAMIGESCTGKSTLANQLQKEINAKIYTGKDYLRLAKNPAQAEHLFCQLLAGAVTGENLIYVISEKTHLRFLPEGTVRILVQAELSVIKERFRQRMRGNLPRPVEEMLERNHGMFDDLPGVIRYTGDYPALLKHIKGISFPEIL